MRDQLDQLLQALRSAGVAVVSAEMTPGSGRSDAVIFLPAAARQDVEAMETVLRHPTVIGAAYANPPHTVLHILFR